MEFSANDARLVVRASREKGNRHTLDAIYDDIRYACSFGLRKKEFLYTSDSFEFSYLTPSKDEQYILEELRSFRYEVSRKVKFRWCQGLKVFIFYKISW